MVYITGACQRQLAKEFGTHKFVEMCSGWSSSTSNEIFRFFGKNVLQYLEDRDEGGLSLSSIPVLRLCRLSFQVYASCLKCGLVEENDTGKLVPLLATLVKKKIEINSLNTRCRSNCSECEEFSLNRLVNRTLLYYFRCFLGLFCRTSNELYANLCSGSIRADRKSFQIRQKPTFGELYSNV